VETAWHAVEAAALAAANGEQRRKRRQRGRRWNGPTREARAGRARALKSVLPVAIALVFVQTRGCAIALSIPLKRVTVADLTPEQARLVWELNKQAAERAHELSDEYVAEWRKAILTNAETVIRRGACR
jgi:hypothetical protein